MAVKHLLDVPPITYRVSISTPSIIDHETSEEILEAKAPGDSYEAAIRRWLGGKVSHAEDALNDQLPDGWNVEVAAIELEAES